MGVQVDIAVVLPLEIEEKLEMKPDKLELRYSKALLCLHTSNKIAYYHMKWVSYMEN